MASKEERQWAARWRSLGSTLTTYGIAMFGAALITPVAKGEELQPAGYAMIIGAFVLHFWGLYLVGRGEV